MSKGCTISSHVLDTETGKPADNLKIALQRSIEEDKWVTLSTACTNADGRVTSDILPNIEPGVYRVLFDVESYYKDKYQGKNFFYPKVPVLFQIPEEARGQHFHIPLLLSPFGYSTYRGS